MPHLTLYRWISGFRWPGSYLGKFLLTAFVGVHVPLIGIVTAVALGAGSWSAALPMLGFTLLAMLAGTLATMMVQGRLLAPVLQTTRALDEYVRSGTLPNLPTQFDDDAGRLMRNAQECVTHLAELLQLKNDMLVVLSHDARAPITRILFATEMSEAVLAAPAVAEADIEELREMNRVVRESARRQLDLMNSMLSLARADSGDIELNRGRVRFSELLQRVAREAQPLADRKGIAVLLGSGVEAAQEVEIDVGKTEQVLANLLHNAIKFTPPGGTVELGSAADRRNFSVYVRDSGIGIPPEARRHLFERFSLAHRSGTDLEGGSGLGLWICKTFTELQGGRIEVESEPGQGSCFRVVIPRAVVLPQTELRHEGFEEDWLAAVG